MNMKTLTSLLFSPWSWIVILLVATGFFWAANKGSKADLKVSQMESGYISGQLDTVNMASSLYQANAETVLSGISDRINNMRVQNNIIEWKKNEIRKSDDDSVVPLILRDTIDGMRDGTPEITAAGGGSDKSQKAGQ